MAKKPKKTHAIDDIELTQAEAELVRNAITSERGYVDIVRDNKMITLNLHAYQIFEEL